MGAALPRILYIIAGLAWYLLLWPNPVTLFVAACLSCLTLPVYRGFRKHVGIWRRRLIKKSGAQSRFTRFLFGLSGVAPLASYIAFILASLFTPIAALALLVSPQAMAGLARLQELRANNFQLPPSCVAFFHSFQESIAEYPPIEKAFNEAIANLDSMFSDMVGMLVSRSFGFVGSTMNIFWLVFLFLTLTILFTVYARRIRKITCRVLSIQPRLLAGFLNSIHRALKAVMLGIVFVALVQGVLCGIGFAVAGVSQPAFWGMLATVVAPIPVIGTALVWLPLCISLWFGGHGMAAVGLGIWGAVFVAGVDNILRPLFLQQGIKAPFFVLILVMLCGLSVFGATGLIAGPILLAIAMQAVDEANRCYRTPD